MNDAARERMVALEGGHNFRDIGGYRTRHGTSVAWGKVFRSGTLAELTRDDHAILEPLGIAGICDLRSSRERLSRPTRLAAGSPIQPWARDHETSTADLVGAMKAPGADAASSRQKMIELYRTLAYEQAPSYRELFRRIAAGELPVVFHCSAGKDRTGIAAALLLDVLGVDRTTVIEDYVMSEAWFDRLRSLVGREPDSSHYGSIDPDVLAPMLRADPAYIETMFDAVEHRHGSAAAFLDAVVGVDEVALTDIRRHLLVAV